MKHLTITLLTLLISLSVWSEHKEINLVCEIIECEILSCRKTEYLKLTHKKDIFSEFKLFSESWKNIPMDKTEQFYRLSDYIKPTLKEQKIIRDLTINRTTLVFTEYHHNGTHPEINTYQCREDNRI